MKTLISLYCSLLAFPLLTVAQYQGHAVKLDLAKPRPGQKINITYSAIGSKLASVTAVDGIVYWLRPKGEPIAQGFNPTKMGDYVYGNDNRAGYD